MTEGKSRMTFNQFLAACAGTPDSQRHGQWAFNVLTFERSDLASQLTGGPLDPWYSDAVLPEFYKWVERNW